mgnify:CR=1 FL=1
MIALKMILALLGPLIFLGIFSEGFNTEHHQEMAIKANSSKSYNQVVKPVNVTHLTSKNTQSEKKG